ncbi:uncharacterized protein LOC135389152 isoform X3 [Ornithodoros turicata]|uniref:uncharacterized protein LOC135389152 isoform X3 n=1 Tax=Ornithodoros turicata TaxID=34597 RepID=UPI0031391F01
MMRLVQSVIFSGRRLLESSYRRLFSDGVVSSAKDDEKCASSDGMISVFRLSEMIFVWACGAIWVAAHMWILLIRWLLECKLVSNLFPIDRSPVKETSGKLGDKLQVEKRVTTNDKSCILCCATFNLLFNKRLQCGECEACVCRDCSSYDARNKVWYCRLCDQQSRSLRAQSCEWFYNNVEMRFNQFGSTKVLLSIYGPKKDLEGSHEPQVTDIQQHMESVLEGFLGEGLDSACIGRMFNHPSYNQVVLDHRVPIHKAVLRFSSSLLTALQDMPKEADLTPTNTHADLKECVQRLCSDANNLPCLREVCEANNSRRNSSSAFSDVSDECDDVSFDAYEDLLVMAVINKAVEIGQRKYSSSCDSKGGDKSCQPDIIQTSKKEHIDVGCQSDIPFSDSGQDEEGFTETTESDEFLWTRSPKEETFPYIIEEKIEEEITEAYTESEDGRTDSDEPDGNILMSLDLNQQNRVPFPEMGVDLVDPGVFLGDEGEEEEEEPGILVASITDWEENWLFRKKQRSNALAAFRGGRYARYFDPINMLIPNPTKEEGVLLGSREVDEFSEMSEKFSVGSLELPSLSESEEEEMVSDVHLSLTQPDASSLREAVPEKPVVRQQQEASLANYSPAFLRQNSVQHPGVAQPTPAPRSTTTQKREVKRQVPKFCAVDKRKSPTSLRFLSQPDATTTMHAGKAARFLCEISSPKVQGVTWFRGTEPLVNTENCRFYRIRGKEFLLELYNVSKADEGAYSAVAYTEKEQLWCDFSLVVRATARAHHMPDFTVAPHVAEWTGEDRLRISCTVSGYPDPRVFFLHNGLPIPESSEKFAVENEGYGEWSLQVENPTVQDEGEYSAVAKNSVGQVVKMVIFMLSDLKQGASSPMKERHPRQSNGSLVTPVIPSKSRPLVIQRTWADREAELHGNARKKENGLRTAQYEEVPSFKNVDEETMFVPSLELFNSPPKPGTIAEREHAKWLNAVPLENNPYSAENLTKRASLGRKDSILSNPAAAHEQDDVEDENPFSPPVLPAACVRDYYINNPRLLARAEASPQRFPSEIESCEERLHSFEEQMYSTPRMAFSPTFQRQQVRSNSPPPLPETPPPGITQMTASKFESGIEVTGRKMAVEEDLSLPSVRELVLKFASPSTQSSLDVPLETTSPVGILPEKAIILEEKESGSCDQLKTWNMSKIHSLTARSLSREFREHAQKNLVPRQMNRSHLAPPSATSSIDTVLSSSTEKCTVGGDTTPGYASDESSTSSAGTPVARVIGAKRRQARNLLQRASYWERRAEQGLLSDSSVTEEFPQEAEVRAKV